MHLEKETMEFWRFFNEIEDLWKLKYQDCTSRNCGYHKNLKITQ